MLRLDFVRRGFPWSKRAALLQCDPDLEALRQGNAQLIAPIAIPLVAALWALLKRKEDRP